MKNYTEKDLEIAKIICRTITDEEMAEIVNAQMGHVIYSLVERLKIKAECKLQQDQEDANA